MLDLEDEKLIKKLASYFSDLRLKKGLGIVDVENATGINRGSLYRLEGCESPLKVTHFFRLCRFYNVTAADFEESEPPHQ